MTRAHLSSFSLPPTAPVPSNDQHIFPVCSPCCPYTTNSLSSGTKQHSILYIVSDSSSFLLVAGFHGKGANDLSVPYSRPFHEVPLFDHAWVLLPHVSTESTYTADYIVVSHTSLKT